MATRRRGGEAAAAVHCGYNYLKPATKKFTCCDFTIFFKQISVDSRYFRFRSLNALLVCQTVEDISKYTGNALARVH